MPVSNMLRPSLTILLVILLSIVNAPALTYYWDANVSADYNQNGNGVWNSSNTNWTTSLSANTTPPTPAPANTAWVNGNNVAQIGLGNGYTDSNADGIITLGENITVNVFSKSGTTGSYTINPGSGYTITLVGSAAGFANNNPATNGALTVNASVGGTVGLKKTHNGIVILTATNSWSGGTTIGTLSTTGSTSVLQIGNGGTTGTLGSGNVTFESNTNTSAQSVLAFNRSDIITLNQNLISDTIATVAPNKGVLRQAGSGTLIISSANAAFTGAIDIDAGILQIGDGSTNGALSGTTEADIATGSTLRFNRTDSTSFGAKITGAGTIEKEAANTLTVTGAGSTHSGQTRIAAGSIKIGNTNALSTSTTLSFTGNSSFELDTYDQTFANIAVSNGVTGTITGTGKLTLGASNLIIGASDLNSNATLDMRGLSSFEFNGASRTFNVGGTLSSNDGATTVGTGTVYLAQNSIIRAQSVNISTVNGGGNAHTNAGFLYLGQANTITAGSLNIGNEIKNAGRVVFASGITDGTVTLRGTAADQRMAINIGRHNSNVVAVTESAFDSTGGTLDALVSTLTLATNINGFTPALGTFSMGLGTLDATTIILGQRLAADTAQGGIGASPIGKLELSGGTIIVRTMTFGDKQDALATGTVTGLFNLNSGTLRAQTIQGGAGTSNVSRLINWSAGTITTYDASTDLTASNVTFQLQGSGLRLFDIGAGRVGTINSAIVNGTTAPTATNTAFRKTGTGTLILAGANTHTGITEINGGTLRTGASNTLSNNSTVHFSANSTLDLQANSDAIADLTVAPGVSATVTGNGGTLSITGNLDWIIGGTSTLSLDMSGLSHFVYNNTTKAVHIGSRGNAANNTATVTLAKDTNTITAGSFGLGTQNDGAVDGQNIGIVHLGKTNTINASNITIGGVKSNSVLDFTTGVTDGTLKIRATNGTGRANMIIGLGQSGGVHTDALVNTSLGSVDALFTTLDIGRNANTGVQNRTTTGVFTMSAGTVDATNIILGNTVGDSSISDATNAGRGTFNLNGSGTVTVSNLIFSDKTGAGAGASDGTFNLTTGTLKAASIRKGTGTGVSTFNWNSGSIENYDASTNLTVTGVSLTLNGSAGTRQFNIGTSLSATINSTIINGTSPGANAFTKIGDGRLILTAANSYTGQTTVTRGMLVAKNSSGSATGFGNLLVASDAIFSGNGIVAPTGSSNITIHGLLDIGDPDATVANTLTFDLTNTTGGFTADGILAVDLFTNAGGDNSGTLSASDRLLFAGIGNNTVDFNGTLYLGLNTGSTLNTLAIQAGDRWQIASFAGLTGASPNVNFSSINSSEIALTSGLGWRVETDTSGIYAVVTSIPEPSRALLLMFGLVAGLLYRRR